MARLLNLPKQGRAAARSQSAAVRFPAASIGKPFRVSLLADEADLSDPTFEITIDLYRNVDGEWKHVAGVMHRGCPPDPAKPARQIHFQFYTTPEELIGRDFRLEWECSRAADIGFEVDS